MIDLFRLLPSGRSHTVAARVTAADNHDDFVLGGYDLSFVHGFGGVEPVLGRQVLHREQDVFISPARDIEVARLTGSHRQADAVEHLPQITSGNILAHVYARLKLDSFGFELLKPAVDDVFSQLEVGNAVAQETADPLIGLKDDHVMSCSSQLLSGRETRRTGADDGHALARLFGWSLWRNPALLESSLDDLVLDVPDEDRFIADSEGARRLARRRTQTAGDFGEVVRRMEQTARLLPPPLEDQFIEVGNEIAERAARPVTERDAAIHAPPCLLNDFVRRERQIQLLEVVNPFFDRPIADGLALLF